MCVIPDEQIAFNGDRLPCFAEMEGRIKDVDLKYNFVSFCVLCV